MEIEPVLEDACLRAYVALGTGRLQEAKSYADRALQKKKDCAPALHFRALCEREMGNFVEAEKSAALAHSVEPENPDHLFLLALCLWSSGSAECAEEKFREVIDNSVPRTDYLVDFGTFLMHQKKFEQAVGVASEILALEPDNEKAKMLLICAKERVWREELDDLSYMPAIPADPNSSSTHLRIAEICMEGDFFDEALAWVSSALELEPESSRGKALYGDIMRIKSDSVYRLMRKYSRVAVLPPVAFLAMFALALALVLAPHVFVQPVFFPVLILFLIFIFLIPYVSQRRIDKAAWDAAALLREDHSKTGSLCASFSTTAEIQMRLKELRRRRIRTFTYYSQLFSALCLILFFVLLVTLYLQAVLPIPIQEAALNSLRLSVLALFLICGVLTYHFHAVSRRLGPHE